MARVDIKVVLLGQQNVGGLSHSGLLDLPPLQPLVPCPSLPTTCRPVPVVLSRHSSHIRPCDIIWVCERWIVRPGQAPVASFESGWRHSSSQGLYPFHFAGKSCLVDRYINQAFDCHQKNTIGAAFAAKRVRECYASEAPVFCHKGLSRLFAILDLTNRGCIQREPFVRNSVRLSPLITRLFLQVRLSDDRSVTLGIWDTAGAERFESLSRVYYHSARAAVVCFDATSVQSWQKLKFWVSAGPTGGFGRLPICAGDV